MDAIADSLTSMGWLLPVVGVLTAGLVFSSFYMQTMVRLRVAAISSNVALLAYGVMSQNWPSVFLPGLLLPLNIWRLHQMRRTLDDIKTIRSENVDLGKMLPFLRPQKYDAGTVLFSVNDPADKAYYLVRGRITLPDIPAELGEGSLFGEVGVFAGAKRRTSTALCKTDVELYILDESTVTTAFYQNPKFAFYLVTLIAGRLYATHSQHDGTAAQLS